MANSWSLVVLCPGLHRGVLRARGQEPLLRFHGVVFFLERQEFDTRSLASIDKQRSLVIKHVWCFVISHKVSFLCPSYTIQSSSRLLEDLNNLTVYVRLKHDVKIISVKVHFLWRDLSKLLFEYSLVVCWVYHDTVLGGHKKLRRMADYWEGLVSSWKLNAGIEEFSLCLHKQVCFGNVKVDAKHLLIKKAHIVFALLVATSLTWVLLDTMVVRHENILLLLLHFLVRFLKFNSFKLQTVHINNDDCRNLLTSKELLLFISVAAHYYESLGYRNLNWIWILQYLGKLSMFLDFEVLNVSLFDQVLLNNWVWANHRKLANVPINFLKVNDHDFTWELNTFKLNVVILSIFFIE